MSKVQYVTRPAMKPLLEPYGLSEAVKSPGFLHVAGQTGMSEQHQVVEGGLKAQALQAFRNIKAIVELAGGDTADLVSLTWYLADSSRSFMEDAMEVMAAQHEILPGIAPGSTAVRVKALLTPEILIEIQAVAAL
jgi:enamine deaminase RidA (YjgF/YER057c/UK114 family)